jgi:hypothetical protein
METSAAWDTVSVVELDTEPEAAVIVVDPVDSLVARPWLPALLLMVAIDGAEELQCTIADKS